MIRPASAPTKAHVVRLRQAKAALEAADYTRASALARPLARLGDLQASQILGLALHRIGDIEGALAAIETVHRHMPTDAQSEYNLALIELAAGRWESGFRHLEARWRVREVAPWITRLGPAWDGSSLAGRSILLHAEQGFGDTIQFARYARLCGLRGARVVLAAHTELRTLLSPLKGVDQVVSAGDPIPRCDTHISLMSLPGLFGVRPDNILESAPYISASAVALHHGGGIGLAWAGNRADSEDRFRSLSTRALSHLLGLLQPHPIVSLQKHGEDELDSIPAAQVVRLGQHLTSFAQTASAIMALDLVITVDTSVAHLAGALGKPVWLLLQACPDWRWLRGSTTTPWYPTMRLFRQHQLGDWSKVFEDVGRAMAFQ